LGDFYFPGKVPANDSGKIPSHYRIFRWGYLLQNEIKYYYFGPLKPLHYETPKHPVIAYGYRCCIFSM